jgi:hypothetical protein
MMRSGKRKSRVSWLGRFVQGRRPDRNPLRRASDLVETAVLAVLVIAFAVAAPFTARATGAWVHAIAHRVQVTQQASLRQVRAVLLNAAPAGPDDAQFLPQVKARWTAPDGKTVTGQVSVQPGTPAGTAMRVWTTRDGQLTNPPLQDSQVAEQADLGEIAGVLALAIVLAVTGLLARRALDKRRMTAWETDWRTTEPRWTTRRKGSEH